MDNEKKTKDIKRVFFGFLILFFLFFTNIVFALEVDYPSFPGIPDINNSTSMEDITIYRFRFIIIISGFIALLSLVIAGARYLTSTGKPDKMASAKEQISNAFFGLLLLLSSFLLLQAISPKFVELGITKPEKIETPEIIETSDFPIQEFRSSIYTEIPFGKIIEQYILENKNTIEEDKKDKRKSRMERILDIGENSLQLGEKLKKQSEELKELAQKCDCTQLKTCCENSNPGPACTSNLCVSKPGCTGDPCKNSRDNIQKKEKENLKAMYEGTEVKQDDISGNSSQVTTSLRTEQERASQEIRLIKYEIDKIERAETFMIECPLWSITNLSDYLDTKNFYLEKKWRFEPVNFWSDIRVIDDWATVYCAVSGNTWESNYQESSGKIEDLSKSVKRSYQGFSSDKEPVTCTTEISIGELMDRAKRTGYKLVERLEKIIDLNEQLTKAVNDLHTLVSQCSSLGPSADPPRAGCFSQCHKTILNACIKQCIGLAPGWQGPCPAQKIEEKIKEIKDIVEGVPNQPAENEEKKEKEGIKDVLEAKKKTKKEAIEDNATREQIGIKPIVNEVVPKIIEDLAGMVRNPIKKCVSGFTGISQVLSCSNSINGIGPEDKLIKECCYNEKWFQECLGQCYLEGPKNESSDNNSTGKKEESEYKKCLKSCQDKKAKETKIDAISDCLHLINFYCCSP
ncbi:MAG: hypothetical protein ABH956_00660 [Candidatus Nealsonbacteria bacterium]